MNKNIFFMATLFVASMVVFTGCGKDNDGNNNGNGGATSMLENNTILGTIAENSSFDITKITEIKVYADNNGEFLIGEGAVTDFTFSVKLSEPPASALKTNFANVPEGVIVSNPNVKTATANVTVVGIGSGYSIFKAKITSDGNNKESYTYADSDATVTGSYTDNKKTITMNVNLKKGWNVITTIESGTSLEQKTGTRVEGLSWLFW